MTNPEEEKPLRIECADGNTREVTFQPGTKLVSHSRVISESGSAGEAIEKQGLSERQLRGLRVGRGIQGWELLPVPKPEDFIPPRN